MRGPEGTSPAEVQQRFSIYTRMRSSNILNQALKVFKLEGYAVFHPCHIVYRYTNRSSLICTAIKTSPTQLIIA